MPYTIRKIRPLYINIIIINNDYYNTYIHTYIHTEMDCYLWINLQKPNIPHNKIEGHHIMGHLFKITKDYRKHTYIAVPEVTVLKDEEDQHGTPVDGQDPPLGSYDLVPEYPTKERGLSQSTLTTATKVAESENVSKCELINEHHQLEKASKEKLAEAFGVPPEELAAQEQEYKLLQNKKEEKDRRERLHGGVGNLPACSTNDPDRDPRGEQFFDAAAEPRRKSNNDLKPSQYAQQPDFHQQQSEGSSPNLSRKNPLQEYPPTYPFDIGSIVEVNLNDKTVSGTVRWLGYLPKTPKVIAGVELVSLLVLLPLCIYDTLSKETLAEDCTYLVVCMHVCMNVYVWW